MQLPGVGGSEAGGPKEGADVAGWRNNRKTSVSGENEQGDVEGAGLLSPGQWVEVGWKFWTVQSRGVI